MIRRSLFINQVAREALGSPMRLVVSLTAGMVGLLSTAHAQYVKQLPNTYVQQSQGNYCGPATASMILNGLASPAAVSVPGQAAMFTSMNSRTDGNYWCNPTELRNVVAANDPGRTYVAYNMANYNSAVRTLAYNVDHYNVTGGALINAGGHWVNVYGINTSAIPTLTGAYTVNGFYLKDPAAVGLGRNFYSANTNDTATTWQRLFTPTNYGGSWQGNYAFVTDPDPGADPSNSEPTETPNATNAGQAVVDAALDTASNSGLSGDSSFTSGAFSPAGETEIFDATSGIGDWIVPYIEAGQVTGVDLINANTGMLDGAYWDEGVLSGDSLATIDSFLANQDAGILNHDNIPTTPEPGAYALLIASSITLLGVARRKRRN